MPTRKINKAQSNLCILPWFQYFEIENDHAELRFLCLQNISQDSTSLGMKTFTLDIK
jgi:hypothetical protein